MGKNIKGVNGMNFRFLESWFLRGLYDSAVLEGGIWLVITSLWVLEKSFWLSLLGGGGGALWFS